MRIAVLTTLFLALSAPLSADDAVKLVADIDSIRKQHGLAAAAVIVVDADSVLLEHYSGITDWESKKPVTRDTYFRIGSISKVFTGIALLKAELSVAGKELGIIIGLAAGALTLALLTLILLYVGTFLFMGDWLFGSMGWGIIHGTLLAGALIGIIAVNLAGGQIGAYLWGVVWGVLVAVLLSLLLISNLLREAAVAGAEAVENDIPLHPHLLPTVVGFVVGAAILAVAALIAGWRSDWKYGSPLVMTIIGIGLGGFVGMLFASTVYDNPNGVVGLGIMVGLIVWISVGAWLASRRGFDPEARYESLVPRESMASFETTRTFMEQQMERQKKRFMGR
jgi:hypothetical protein